MKKTYIIPTVITTVINTETLIAASPDGFNGSLGTTGVDGNATLVKEQDTESYNVWDDDWSR